MMKLVKKAMALLLVGAMACGTLVGCGNSEKETTKAAEGNTTEAAETAAAEGGSKEEAEAAGDFKIAIMYTDASQGEEPTRAYENLKEKYGDMVVGSSFPTNEQEVLMSTALGLVADPEVKALLIFQEPAGSAAAVKACREVRPDVLYMAGVVAEDPDVVEDAFDFIIDPDKIQ